MGIVRVKSQGRKTKTATLSWKREKENKMNEKWVYQEDIERSEKKNTEIEREKKIDTKEAA